MYYIEFHLNGNSSVEYYECVPSATTVDQAVKFIQTVRYPGSRVNVCRTANGSGPKPSWFKG